MTVPLWVAAQLVIWAYGLGARNWYVVAAVTGLMMVNVFVDVWRHYRG